MCTSILQECTNHSQITRSVDLWAIIFICAEFVHVYPTESPVGFCIIRTILQPSVSHLSGVSHWNDQAFLCLLFLWRDGSSKSVWVLSYITISSFPVSVVCLLSLTDTFSLPSFLYLSRSPPRPSPGSLHYSDEDVSTKYNDLIPAESSSLTEKPSEISDSQVSSDPGLQPMPTPCLE